MFLCFVTCVLCLGDKEEYSLKTLLLLRKYHQPNRRQNHHRRWDHQHQQFGPKRRLRHIQKLPVHQNLQKPKFPLQKLRDIDQFSLHRHQNEKLQHRPESAGRNHQKGHKSVQKSQLLSPKSQGSKKLGQLTVPDQVEDSVPKELIEKAEIKKQRKNLKDLLWIQFQGTSLGTHLRNTIQNHKGRSVRAVFSSGSDRVVESHTGCKITLRNHSNEVSKRH